MGTRLRSWWQQIKRHSVRTVLIAFLVVVIVLTILSILGYIFNWDWVVLGPYISPPHSTDSDFQRGKTLWDWLQLLIIPAVLVVAGYIINLTISRTERTITQDNQREAALQEYINKMSELILDKDNPLRDSAEEDGKRTIARVRTMTVLPRLDGKRKGILLQFLHESDLINKDTHIIGLIGADLSTAILYEADLSGNSLWINDLRKADLSEANLYRAKLSNADLSNAKLYKINLRQADLSAVDLSNANLDGADLTGAIVTDEQLATAKSLKGAIMPDGKMYRNSSGANLIGAKLSGVDMSGVDLSNAILFNADLSNANLDGANLNKAWVTKDQVAKAKSRKGATMPDGSIHP